jgi:lipoate-protein ligase A
MNWRLIEDGAHSGAWNMALDEALLLAQAATNALPTLRFYDWQPACLSLGRFQKGFVPPTAVDWVRRPTGGRAVWHQHEVTYCAVFPAALLPSGATSVVGAYRWLTQGFLAGLQQIGVNAELSDATSAVRGIQSTLNRQKSREENCFLSAAQCDTVVDGRKLIGAAQCRKTVGDQTLILQHGSLLLDMDRAAWQNVLGDTPEAMRHIVSLRELGVKASREDVVAALVRGMTTILDAHFVHDTFTAQEQEMAARLYNEKYTCDQWNRAGQEKTQTSEFA